MADPLLGLSGIQLSGLRSVVDPLLPEMRLAIYTNSERCRALNHLFPSPPQSLHIEQQIRKRKKTQL
jgi:hypothetical protein